MPDLEHLPLTCETGPGSPSGHSMSSAAVGFVLISALIDQYVQKIKDQAKRRYVERALWTGYGIAVALIGVARLRLATHFPHQVLLGAFAGKLRLYLRLYCTVTGFHFSFRPRWRMARVEFAH